MTVARYCGPATVQGDLPARLSPSASQHPVWEITISSFTIRKLRH